jgi:outer membrane immunogenic protein
MMKRLLIGALAAGFACQCALAADAPIPRQRGVQERAPVYDPFSGPYLGVMGGWGRYKAHDQSSLPGGTYDGAFSADGWLLGVQAGYDLQAGYFVLGVVADYAWADINGSKSVPLGGATLTIPHSINEIGTARVRGGIVFFEQLLLYGTVGAAYAKTEASLNFPGFTASSDTDRIGWAYGGGIEWKLFRNVSLGLEYLHADFGTRNVAFGTPFGGLAVGVPVKLDADIVKGSLNWRW